MQHVLFTVWFGHGHDGSRASNAHTGAQTAILCAYVCLSVCLCYMQQQFIKTNFVQTEMVSKPLLAAHFVCACVLRFICDGIPQLKSFGVSAENPSKSLNEYNLTGVNASKWLLKLSTVVKWWKTRRFQWAQQHNVPFHFVANNEAHEPRFRSSQPIHQPKITLWLLFLRSH